jgi:peptidylprolyl isomerase
VKPVLLRRAATLTLSALLLTSLTACGDDAGEGAEGAERLDSVTIEGEVGSAPKVTWEDQMSADKVEVETLIEGDGADVAEGDVLSIHYWIGNGFTERKSYSSYDEGGAPEQITVDDQLTPVFAEAFDDAKIGSRVAVTASAEEAFGEAGNAQLGLAPKDTVLVIIDVIEEYVPPAPVEPPASKLPDPVFEKGEPVRFDFKGVAKPKPDGELLRTVLKEGTGKLVTTEMTVTANYLGQVYGADGPFDESYSKKPVPFALTGVVGGWTYGLSGLKVGTRVLLQIPPDLGYGAQDKENIPPNSTLYFIVDIISAK